MNSYLLLAVAGGVPMPKPFMTYDQQIQKLRDKHLIVADEDSAKDILRQIGYFTLITGYKDLFKNPTTKNYRDGTTFQDILTLYRFDQDLRQLTLNHLLHVEQHIRSALSYAFCASFGESQIAYTTVQNYQYTSRANQTAINTLIQKHLNRLLNNRTDYPYIEHYKTIHQNVPLWVLVNALTFGTVSKMYALFKPQLQTVISREFDGINERQLGQILEVLTVYRNVCAHGDRLFSYRCAKKDIPDLVLHRKLSIPRKGTQYIQGKRDYFAVVVSFRYLLPGEEFLIFKKHLSKLIDRAVQNNSQVNEGELLRLMGMPSNWKRITAYKKTA